MWLTALAQRNTKATSVSLLFEYNRQDESCLTVLPLTLQVFAQKFVPSTGRPLGTLSGMVARILS